jgi:Flp pilus assembly protein TadD
VNIMRLCRGRYGNLLRTTAILAVLATTAGGCKTSGLGDVTTSSGGALGGGLFGSAGSKAENSDNVTDWRREANTAGARYRNAPRNADAALRYAEALRKTGQRAQAAAVLQQASIHNPHDKRVLGDYGRALAENGQLPQAYDMLGRAHSPDQPDWRVLSAQGAVLDQLGRHDAARAHYEAALKIVPDEPSVLSNLGLSYALSKELPQAEETLRKAAARNGKDRRVRQNLALVIGLQGRFKEAEDIARADLPSGEAAENVAYLRSLLPRPGETTAVAAAKPAPAAKPRNVAKRGGSGKPAAAKPAPRTAAARPAPGTTAAQARSKPMVLGAGG